MSCKCDSQLARGQNKNKYMICYVMVIDLREKHYSLLGKRGLFMVLFFSWKKFLCRERTYFLPDSLSSLATLQNLQH